MFLDCKTFFVKSQYYPECDLQIKRNPYQNFSDALLQKEKIHPKMHMESQGNPNSQNYLE